MKKLQVKYCQGEEVLNNFLMTLNIEGCEYPRLQSISYLPEVQGGGTESDFNVGSQVIAAVQYLIEVK